MRRCSVSLPHLLLPDPLGADLAEPGAYVGRSQPSYHGRATYLASSPSCAWEVRTARRLPTAPPLWPVLRDRLPTPRGSPPGSRPRRTHLLYAPHIRSSTFPAPIFFFPRCVAIPMGTPSCAQFRAERHGAPLGTVAPTLLSPRPFYSSRAGPHETLPRPRRAQMAPKYHEGSPPCLTTLASSPVLLGRCLWIFHNTGTATETRAGCGFCA